MEQSKNIGGLLDLCFPPRYQHEQVNKLATAKVVVLSIALAALTAVAAYFCIVHGLNGLDMATRSAQLVGYGVLAYTGIAFGLAAAVNAIFAIYKRPSDFDSKRQVGLTLAAPLAAIPLALFCTACATTGNAMRLSR